MIFAAVLPGHILSCVLREKDMSQKEASIITGIDPAHFCRMLRDEGPFDLQKVKRLPYRILAPFWRKFFFDFLDEDMSEMRSERLVMVRSELFTQREERKSS